MPQTATIKRKAFEVVKAMQTDGLDWGEGYRHRRALAEMDGWSKISGSATSTALPHAIAATAPATC